MGRPIINLIGEKYGKLTVIQRVKRPEHILHGTYWLCSCDCGGEIIVNAGDLKKGGTASCGCMRFNNLKGKTFGRLTVLYLDDITPKDSSGSLKWVCQCDCGNIKSISSSALVKNKTKSCGCLQKETASFKLRKPKNHKNIVNMKFGKLTVINKDIEDDSFLWCICDCGNKTRVNYHNLINDGTKSCGCLKSSGEEKILNVLQINNINYKKEFTFPEWINTDYWRYRYDFAIFDNENNLKFIIEYDGFHHFGFTNQLWNTEGNYFQTIKSDNYKSNYCNLKQIPLLRIAYWDLENIEAILSEWLNY